MNRVWASAHKVLVSKGEEEGLPGRLPVERRREDPQVRGSARGESRTPTPFRAPDPKVDAGRHGSGSTCHPMLSGVFLCHPVSFRREQAVSKSRCLERFLGLSGAEPRIGRPADHLVEGGPPVMRQAVGRSGSGVVSRSTQRCECYAPCVRHRDRGSSRPA